MIDPAGSYSVKVHPSLHEIPAADWDALAGIDHPFTRHAYLVALEDTGCATARTGWAPAHIGVYDALGQLCAALPLYLKSHSYGEYVFDHAWAEAYERAGGRYYPKLQASVPFTPVTGPRLMARDPVARKALLEAALGLLPRTRASSLHLTFPTHEDWQWLGEHGFLLRQDRQFWWQNAGYTDFEAFLAALSSGRRKTIRRERREAQSAVEIVVREGADLSAAEWDAFYHFYLDTGARKWGQPYLNRAFFDQISRTLADQIVMMLAQRDGDWVAGAINFKSSDTLYGRQWGAIETIPFLHFELCYYQAIDYAIKHGLERVEAGAQGEHKLARGYLPRDVYSAHYIADPALRAPVARYLDQERQAVRADNNWLESEYSPFKVPPVAETPL